MQVGKPLFRRTKDGKIFEWKVENDDPLCTLQEAFEKVEHSIGFNIDLKLDNQVVYTEEELTRVLQAILQVYMLTLKLNIVFCIVEMGTT
jgi:glycerophosphodiester phosphodiesterase